MKTQPDIYLYLLKKVRGWCKRQDMTDPEMYFHCTFGNFSEGMVCSSPKLKPGTTNTGVIIHSPSHQLPALKYSEVQMETWKQSSTSTPTSWIISNTRIYR